MTAEAVLESFPASSLANHRRRIILDTQHWGNTFRPSFMALRSLYDLADKHSITISLRTSTPNFYFQEIRPRKLIPVDFRKGSLHAATETVAPTKTDRPYQIEAREAVVDHTENGGRRGLVVMPTGTGKTYTFRKILAEVATKPRFAGKKILVVAHQDQIMEQNALELAEEFGIDNIGLVQGTTREWDKTVVVATVQSLLSNADDVPWEEFGICVLDEAHHYVESNEWFEVVRRFETDEDKYVLGVTATPDRLSGDPLVNVYGADLLYCRDINYFIRHGYLLNPVGKTLHLEGRDNEGKLLTARETWKALSMDEKAEVVFRSLTDTDMNVGFEETRAMVFLSSKAEVRGITSRLNHRYGVAAVDIVDDSPDRSARLNDFRQGRYRVLLGVNAISEGVDVPSANRAFLFRDSESRATIAQQIGRILRPDPEDVARTEALVVDGMGVLAKHHIQVPAEEAYTWGKTAEGIHKVDHETPEVREVKVLGSLSVVTTSSFGNLVIEKNHFAEILDELIADTDRVIQLAYLLGMSSDELMNWYFGRSIPQSEKQVRALAALLGGDTEKVVIAYKETVGDAIKRYLIQKLLQRAGELGRTPLGTDMGEDGYPSQSVYYHYFDSWNKALEMAGLVTNTNRQIGNWDYIKAITHLKLAARTPLKSENGVVPEGTRLTMTRYRALTAEHEGWPHEQTLERIINTGKKLGWNDALKAAGLATSQTSEVLGRKEAIAHLQLAAKTPLKSENGMIPEGTKLIIVRYTNLAKENVGWPPVGALTKWITGNENDWNDALKAAGLATSRTSEVWNREKAIAHLQMAALTPLASEKGNIPQGTRLTSTRYQILNSEHPDWPNFQTLSKAITGKPGHWTAALDGAGLKTAKEAAGL